MISKGFVWSTHLNVWNVNIRLNILINTINFHSLFKAAASILYAISDKFKQHSLQCSNFHEKPHD